MAKVPGGGSCATGTPDMTALMSRQAASTAAHLASSVCGVGGSADGGGSKDGGVSATGRA
jgi:hypothetical protein